MWKKLFVNPKILSRLVQNTYENQSKYLQYTISHEQRNLFTYNEVNDDIYNFSHLDIYNENYIQSEREKDNERGIQTGTEKAE